MIPTETFAGHADGDGFDAVRTLRSDHPTSRVLILTTHGDEPTVARALAAGAHGYVIKDQSGTDLIEAIHRVTRGQPVVPRSISRFALDECMAAATPAMSVAAPPSAVPPGPLAALTAREKEVYMLLIAGRSNAAIACKLKISPKTVETHRARITKKLHTRNMGDLLRFAFRHGMLRQ